MFWTQGYGDEYPTEIRGFASDEVDDSPEWPYDTDQGEQ